MTMQNWQKFAWQWLTACAAMKLLQIWFDGVGGSFATIFDLPSTMGLFIILALFRGVSGAWGGAFQVWALPQGLVNRKSWIIATAMGMAITFLAMQWLWVITRVTSPSGMPGFIAPPISSLPMFILESVMGIVLGTAQWFVLKKNVPRAGLWILVNGLAMAVADIVIGLLQQTLGRGGVYVSPDATNPIFWAIAVGGAIFYAALTGSFLFWTLTQQIDTLD